LKELIHYGYVEQTCSRGEGKINAYHYRVYEQPFSGAEKGLSLTDQDGTSGETEGVFQEATPPSIPSKKPHTDSQDTDFQEEAETLSMRDTALLGEEPGDTPVHPRKLHTKNLHPENPTQVSKKLKNNQLTIHKTRSSHARCVIFELWEETFGHELSIREYDRLVGASHRTLLTKTICLIQQYHNVASIQSPSAFVYSCVTQGGYQIAKSVTTSRAQYVEQKRVPLTKDVQMQRDGKKFPSPYTEEELEEKMAYVKEQIRMLSERPDQESDSMVVAENDYR
jgi:hypothetical protein